LYPIVVPVYIDYSSDLEIWTGSEGLFQIGKGLPKDRCLGR
jgi:hypothetical protein